jgi:hypothetical protein
MGILAEKAGKEVHLRMGVVSACQRLGTVLVAIPDSATRLFTQKPKVGFYLCFAAIALLDLAVYFPSFSHGPRGDHIGYLAETAGQNDWFTLAIKSYALNRSRTFIAGDEAIFRPVQYFALGTERWLYGYHFYLWQMTGFALHLGIVWCMLRVLLQIRQGIFAPLLAVFFSVLFVGMELVVWHHEHALLLFVLFALGALYNLQLYFAGGRTSRWRLWASVACLSVAAFSCEIGAAFSPLFAAYAWIAARRKAACETSSPQEARVSPYKPALVLMIPLCAYVLASGSDYLSRCKAPILKYPVVREFNLEKTVWSAIYADTWWTYSGLFPSYVPALAGGRITIVPGGLFASSKFMQIRPPEKFFFIGVGISAILAYLVALVNGVSWVRLKAKWPFILFALSMLAAYLLMLAVGRFNTVGVQWSLMINLYYSYIFWVFFVIFVYALVDATHLQGLWRQILKSVSVCLLLTLTVLNGLLTHNMNVRMAEWSKPELALVKDIEALIKEHGAEKDFSFAVPLEHPGNAFFDWLWKSGDPPDKRYSFAEALYVNCYREKNPKYTVGADNQIKVCRPQLYKRDYYKGFDVYLCGYKCYALTPDEGPFDIGKAIRKEYRRLVIGNWLDQMKHLIDQSLKRDMRGGVPGSNGMKK